jgi:branched-chain amino acid transport system ATP-binding protein
VSPAEPVLELQDLCAGHGRAVVVRGLDLCVRAGEVVALLGPNGAGKTTTLLTVSGLLPTMGGTIKYLGHSTRGRRPQHLSADGMAHVPDDRGLFPGLTVAEHLDLATGRLGRAGRAAARARVVGWFPQLAPLLDRRAGLLSGGEQQMLALARALVREPRLLMVDEMSLGLAPIVVESLLPIVRQVAEESGCGVLLVEQHAPMALEVADHAVVLSHGDVVTAGSADELLGDREGLLASYLG